MVLNRKSSRSYQNVRLYLFATIWIQCYNVSADFLPHQVGAIKIFGVNYMDDPKS